MKTLVKISIFIKVSTTMMISVTALTTVGIKQINTFVCYFHVFVNLLAWVKIVVIWLEIRWKS